MLYHQDVDKTLYATKALFCSEQVSVLHRLNQTTVL